MSFYNKNTADYTEIGIAVAKYKYGGKVKLNIPALLPLSKHNKLISDTDENDDDNLLNKNPNNIDLGKVTECNYIELTVPLNMCPNCEGMKELLEKNLKIKVLPNNCGCPDNPSTHNHETKIKYKCKHEGNKGDKFVVLFIGGDINNPIIYRRYDD